jgi:hypothetical protein
MHLLTGMLGYTMPMTIDVARRVVAAVRNQELNKALEPEPEP